MTTLDEQWPSGLTRRELLECVPTDSLAETREVWLEYRHRRPGESHLAISTIRNYLGDLLRDGEVERLEFGNYHTWRRAEP